MFILDKSYDDSHQRSPIRAQHICVFLQNNNIHYLNLFSLVTVKGRSAHCSWIIRMHISLDSSSSIVSKVVRKPSGKEMLKIDF